MKTSEFKKKVKELGYDIVEHRDEYQVWEDEYKVNSDARIFKGTERIIALNTKNYTLIRLCLEYAETPIHEREEEKRYRVRIPDSPERTPVYALCKLVNGCVVINQTNENNFQEHDRYRLTESEIKRNHEYLWQFAKEVQK